VIKQQVQPSVFATAIKLDARAASALAEKII